MEMWWKKAKIYELYVDKFAGTFDDLTEKLPYFLELGINTLHILPHYPSPMIDDGYDVSDYRDVRPELGGLEQFKNFVRAAHDSGLRVITDLVLNHTSDQHPWFVEARSSRSSKRRDYYLWSESQHKFPLAESMIKESKTCNWIYNEATGDHYYATFYAQQPDLNWDNPAVFDEMLGTMRFWAHIGVDGFRLDAIPFLIKRDGTDCNGIPETHAILKRIRHELEKSHSDVILLAEAHQSISDTKKYFGTGDECHMAYHFNLMEQMWLALQRGDNKLVEKMAAESYDIPDNCQWAIFLRNHDEISLATLEPGIRAALVDFLDPDGLFHFKKGQATSMRIGSVFRGDRAGMLRAFELLYSLPGAPIMYYGDEIGMSNLPHEESIIDSRKYVRGTFDWALADRMRNDPKSLFHEVAMLIHGIHMQEPENVSSIESKRMPSAQ